MHTYNVNRTPRKILVIRNDKLGDFMLAFPTFTLLKRILPDTKIHTLAPKYTHDMAKACTAIDHIINDPGADAGLTRQFQLWQEIRKQRYDAVITLYSTTRIGMILWLARIPWRLAPATKIAQLFYNNHLTQRRSRSEKPEFEYNLDLARYYLTQLGINHYTQTTPPFLQFPGAQIQQIHNDFCKFYRINPDHKLIFIHPGSGGSAVNLSNQQFADLASRLRSSGGHTVVISAGPGEQANANQLAGLLPSTVPHVVYISDQGLQPFARHIAFADLFISGSTGPLHIAGALNRPTTGFYPRRQSATSLRWQTLSTDDRRLSFSPDANAEIEDMSSIDIAKVAEEINQKLLAS
ncbi:MAG: glycosyltransferase family 9 protein [Gammaproteobacteria bacterium]|nr:glycosyltransferase family 9 protein [Gammaproteobacteria bacterium]